MSHSFATILGLVSLSFVATLSCGEPARFIASDAGAELDQTEADQRELPSVDAADVPVTTDSDTTNVDSSAPSDTEDTSDAVTCACSPGQLCCDAGCVDPSGSLNCGSCGNACDTTEACISGVCTPLCGAGLLVCAGACIDQQTDHEHCGACEHACGTNEECVGAQCRIICGEGLSVCPEGCADLMQDAESCGACSQACASGEECSNGVCLCVGREGTAPQACSAGTTCCPGVGCLDLLTAVEGCGSCGHTCNTGETCGSGACACFGREMCPPGEICCEAGCCHDGQICCQGQCQDASHPTCACGTQGACLPGEACCDGKCADLEADTGHCGTCEAACGEHQICSGGTCRCTTGWGHCSGQSATACETNLLIDENHCGACNRACLPGETCSNGACLCGAAVCASGMACCSGSCVFVETNLENCGACGITCGSAPNASHTKCSGGVCVPVCRVGYADCDEDETNGCEISLTDDDNHCGTCGIDCTHTGQTCCNAQCRDTQWDVSHCGECDVPCPGGGPHESKRCAAGTCALECEWGYEDCNGDATDGCEANMSLNTSCGECNLACSTTMCCHQQCAQLCQLDVCDPGTTACGTDPVRCVPTQCPEGLECESNCCRDYETCEWVCSESSCVDGLQQET